MVIDSAPNSQRSNSTMPRQNGGDVMTLCTADVEVYPAESDQTGQPQQNVSVASQQGQQSLRPSVIFSEQDLSNALRSVLGGNLSDVSQD